MSWSQLLDYKKIDCSPICVLGNTMDYLDSCYEEYASKRQEELDELEEIAKAEAEELAEYERQLEEIGRTYIEDLKQALDDEAEQEWQEELRERVKEK